MKRVLWAVALAALGLGCDEAPLKAAADGGAAPAGLTPDQAARTLAKVGDKVITLGDFAATLERMDQFDRLRYQTKERRRELLDDMIDVELLAAEARRRGLDKSPETEDAIRQILRDAMLAKARQGLPAPAEIPPEEVNAYYAAHAEMFREPERRRVGAIVMDDKKEAEKVLKAALKLKSATEWGELFFKHSTTPKQKGQAPADLAGDLGIVGPPDDPKGANPRIPEAVRAAVFKVAAVGDVMPELVEAEGKVFIVRLSGLTAAHTRSREDADRSIRVAILQQKMQEREKALEDELRAKFPVEIDDKALAGVKVPAAAQKVDGLTGASGVQPGAAPSTSASAPPPAPPSGSAPAQPR